MKALSAKILALPLEQRAEMALRAAVKEAIAERIRLGQPVYVWSGGKVVELSAAELKKGRRRRRPSRNSPR